MSSSDNLSDRFASLIARGRPPVQVQELAEEWGVTPDVLRKRWSREGHSSRFGTPKLLLAWLTCRYVCGRFGAGAGRLEVAVELGVDERTLDRTVTRVLQCSTSDLRDASFRERATALVDGYLEGLAG